MSPLKFLVTIGAAGMMLYLADFLHRLSDSSATTTQTIAGDRAPLYLPSIERVRVVTLGFNSLAADLLWFSTLSYFGKEFRSGGDYKWLNHRCQLILDLNPKVTQRYEFCSTLLAWVAKDPVNSNSILTRAIHQWPDHWRFLFLRSFNSWYFLSRLTDAAEDLKLASKLPDAPPGLASLAARLLNSTSDPSVAVVYLEDVLRRTYDPNARFALSERLREAVLARDLKHLSEVAQEYLKQTGTYPRTFEEVKNAGLLQIMPSEPFGGRYYFSPDTNEVKTTSGKQPLRFKQDTPQREQMRSDLD